MTFWANTDTGHVISTQEMKEQNPNTVFPTPFEPVDGYVQLEETNPAYDPETEKLSYSETATLVEGKWTREITVIPLTQEEIDDIRKAKVPHTVTRRQARRALALSGLLDLVQPAIDAIPDSLQRQIVQIDWDDALEFRRDDETLLLLAAALGLTEIQLDNLFILAGSQP